jgi:homoserine dehydrogenase
MTQLEGGARYSEAVRRAFDLGYTEPDPRDDLSGTDVARKALILARTLGRRGEMKEIALEPLFPPELSDGDPQRFLAGLAAMDEIMAERLAAARRAREVLRYVARIENDGIRVGVEAVPEASPLGRLQGTDNQVVVHTRRYRTNPLVVTGPGAGAEVTAAGVLNDILAVATGGA